MDIKGICFDMDGVIINSEPSRFKAFQNALNDAGHALTHELYEQYFAGKTDAQGFKEYFASLNLDYDEPSLLSNKSRYYSGIVKAGIDAYEYTIDSIRALSKTYPLALVTGSSRNEADSVIESLSLQPYFQIVITADDITHGKPNPEGYLQAAKELSFPAPACLVIEDSPSGIKAGKSAGMNVLALTTTHAASELTRADHVVSELTPQVFEALGLSTP